MNWFVLPRPLTKFDQTLYGYGHQDSRKRDLADLLADIIGISRCSALVASFDSGYADLMYEYQCNRDARGHCRPDFNRGHFGELKVVSGRDHGFVFEKAVKDKKTMRK